jgi:hypothetical protein
LVSIQRVLVLNVIAMRRYMGMDMEAADGELRLRFSFWVCVASLLTKTQAKNTKNPIKQAI